MGKFTAIQTYSRFLSLWNENKINRNSLTFILDTGQLYTHGIFLNSVAYGTEANGAIDITIAGTSKSLSLSSHIHSNYLEKNKNIDIGTYKIVSGDKDLLYYNAGNTYLGNSTSPVYLVGTEGKIVKGSTAHTLLDTDNFSILSQTANGIILSNSALFKYADRTFSIDYIKRYNSTSNFDSLSSVTSAGTTTVNGKKYGFMTFYEEGATSPSWSLIRIDVTDRKLEFRTSSNPTTWISPAAISIPENTATVAGIVSAPGTNNSGKVWKTDANGTPAWRNEVSNTWRNIRINDEENDSLSTGTGTGALYIKLGSGITVAWQGNKIVISNSSPNIWKAANTSQEGYVPKSIANKILRADADGTLYWGDDANTMYTFSNLLFLQTSGTNLMTYNSQALRTVLAGSNITFTHSNNVLTIAAKDTTYSTVSKTAAGLCPALPNETTTTKYLRLDGTWVTPPNNNTWRGIYIGGASKVGTGTNTLPINFVAGSNVSITYEAAGTESGQSGNAGYFNVKISATDTKYSNFVKSGSGAKAGLVPAPSTTAGTTHYLREDGTWTVPPNDNTWKPANTSLEGYAPKLTTGGGTIGTQSTEYVLTFKSGTDSAPVWRLLPANAYNDHTYTVNNATYSIKSLVGSTTTTLSDFTANQSGNDDFTLVQGSNITFTVDATNRKLTIAGTANTWKAANASQEGYVPKSTANKILRANANGALYWGDDSNTWKEVTTSLEGYVPKIVTTGSLAATDSPFILVFKNVSGSTKTAWVPLPANAFKNDNTWTAWKGATDSANGTAGYMPAPTSALRGQFLRGDGSWVSLNNYSLPTASNSKLGGVKTGAAITNTTGYTAVAIKDGVIYYKDTNTTYTFYNLLFQNSGGTTVDTYKPTTSPTKTLKAGSNVTISAASNVITIASTNTWNAMTGATSSANGTVGYVNAAPPKNGYNTKFLRADGTWSVPAYPTKTSWNYDDVYTKKTLPIPVIVGPSTDTTAGTWTGTTDAFSAYVDGLTIIYVPAVAGASTTTLNINGLGAKTCHFTNTSKLTTHFAVGTPIMFTYYGGYWKRADYDSNSNTQYYLTLNGTVKGHSGKTDLGTIWAPSSLASTGGYILATNSGKTGLEWVAKPTSNVTSALYVGASNGTSNSAQSTNGNVYLIFAEGSSYSRYKIVGSGRASVTSDTSGNITINSSGYSNFGVATASAAGSAGLVPAPGKNVLGSAGYYLRADGTWQKPPNDNTWNANAVGVAGYVAAPTKAANANMTWQTDANGNPAWRASNNHSHSYLPLSGANYNTSTDTNPFTISRAGGTNEAMLVMINDNRTLFKYTNDEAASSIIFQLVNTDTESGGGKAASDRNVTISSNNTGISLFVGGTLVSLDGHNHNSSYVSSLTTSGNSLRWVKNGSNNDITIPYATSAGGVAWSNVSSKPTTLSGYGITDGLYSKQVASTQTNVTWAINLAKTTRRAFIYNTSGTEWSYLFGLSSSNTSVNNENCATYGVVLKMTYADRYLRMIRVHGGKWYKTDGTLNATAGATDGVDWEKIYAGYADSAGSVTWANVSSKPAAAGNATTPVYWTGSGFTKCTAYGSASVNYATSAGNADTVDGYHVTSLKTVIRNSKSIGVSSGAGWYRILDCTSYSMSFFITFYGGYHNQPPTPVTYLVSHSYNTTAISQIGKSAYLGWIQAIRAVHHDTYKFYIDVKFGVNGNNAANEVAFEVTPMDNRYTSFSLIDYTKQSNGNGDAKCDTSTSFNVDYASSAGSVAWSNISSKPATATRWPAWSEVTNKPSSFAPSSHDHTRILYIDDRDVVETPTDVAGKNGIEIHFKNKSKSSIPSSGTWTAVVMLDGYSDTSGGYPMELGFSMSDVSESRPLYLRSPKSATEWGGWRTIIDSGNIGSQSVKNADTVDNKHASAFAHVGAHNNLTASGNEFTFASSGFSGKIYLNYRTAGGTNGNITEYILGNGKGGALGTIIHSGNYASYCLPKSGGTMTGNISMNNSSSITNLPINGGIYWNPYVESSSDGSDAASIRVVKGGVAGGTTLVISQQNDSNDTIQFATNGSANLYHNSNKIWDAGNDGSDSGLDADLLDGWHNTKFCKVYTREEIGESPNFDNLKDVNGNQVNGFFESRVNETTNATGKKPPFTYCAPMLSFLNEYVSLQLMGRSGQWYIRGGQSGDIVNANANFDWDRIVINSGTWNISITGNADKLDGYHASSFVKNVTGTATSVTSLNVGLTFIYATLTASATLGLSAAMSVGQVLTVLAFNNSSASITLTVPSAWKSLDGYSIIIGALKFGEISILCYASGSYMVSSKVQ